MLSDDEFDHSNTCEPHQPVSSLEQEEVSFIKRMMALPDRRPDPGTYRSADWDGAALDLFELERIYAWPDARPLTTPWRPYLTVEDLTEDPCE